MAEGQQTPTFKLVLVGDGGTGKVSATRIAHCEGLSAEERTMTDYCIYRPPSSSAI